MKFIFLFAVVASLGFYACSGTKSQKSNNDSSFVEVNPDYFNSANAKNIITKVQCTLSDGSKTECYKIISNSTPTDHRMGPWCPTNISDDAEAGGIWLEKGKVYDVDGAFIKNMGDFYKDNNWRMYDDDGKIYVTATEQDCINAANPNVGEAYKNFCVECLPSYITNVSKTYLIPVKPVYMDDPMQYMQHGGGANGGKPKRPGGDRPPRGDKESRDKPPRGDRPPRDGGPQGREGGMPSTRGIALNGVEFSAPAPVNNILGAYTLAPFDDAGGHINVHQGYHYHTATGISYSVKQNDGHAPLIGYAIDGYGIYGHLDEGGQEAKELDECRGHVDDIRGYHYHVDNAGNNNFINCLRGAYATSN